MCAERLTCDVMFRIRQDDCGELEIAPKVWRVNVEVFFVSPAGRDGRWRLLLLFFCVCEREQMSETGSWFFSFL